MNRKQPSEFYRELMQAISQANAEGRDVTYRGTVLQMGLSDSFCGKIKHGQYTPTKERLEILSSYLGKPAHEFNAFVKRYADEQVDRDKDILETFRVLSGLNSQDSKVLKKAIKNYAVQVAGSLKGD